MAAKLWITFFNTSDKSAEEVPSVDALISLLAVKEGFYWLDLTDNHTGYITDILTKLGIPNQWPNFFRRPEILPHMKDTPRLLSFYLYDVVGSETLLDSEKTITQIEHAPIFVMIGENFVITYHQRPLDLLEFAKRDCAENFKIIGKTAAFVVFLLMQHSMYHFSRLNLANDNFLDKIEYSVLSQCESVYMPKISTAGLNILMLKKLNANLHIILLVIVTKHNLVIGEEARIFFNHMLQNSESIRASIDSSRDLLDSIIASMQAESARKTGEVMRVLTILSAVFMPMSLIAGIYGMNFHVMPELSWHYGYFLALGLMVTIAMGFLSVFYYIGWIGAKRS